MAKAKTKYICQNCAHESARWVGQCPNCQNWNTFVETVVIDTKPIKGAGFDRSLKSSIVPVNLSAVAVSKLSRTTSGYEEFDRVLGGGFVPGQVILLSGEPGIGKSTLLTQLCKNLKKRILYVAGEESPSQIKIRADRLGYSGENMIIISETNLEEVGAFINSNVSSSDYDLIVVDSVQSMISNDLTGIAGSIGQVRLSTQILTNLAKQLSVPTIIVGHITKEGEIAGPKILEHIVDTVLHLEGDTQHLFRILKTNKNRFGPVSEVGIFEMQGSGLEEVKNPAKLLLNQETKNVPGSCVTVVMEGYRPLLFEVQALTVKTAFGYPRRTTSGISVNRLQVLIATIEKRANISLSDHDVYVNIAGGFKVNEYAADLGICLAIISAVKNTPIKDNTVAVGECGLLGEIRKITQIEKRINEAQKLGYNNVISPENVKNIKDAIKKAF